MRIINKKILEAVNRGIQMALDDYQDIEPNSSISSSNDVINAKDVVQHQINFWSNWVDLGLPSGTLWAKYNLGVDQNNLSDLNSWYGDYYAWGEIKTKNNFCKDTYKFHKYEYIADEEFDVITKYAINKRNGKIYDGLCDLLPEDDVAYQTDSRMKIPSIEQFKELLKYTTNTWEEDYKGIKGLNGRLFKSNTNELFFPASGEFIKNNFKLSGYRGHYWTNTCKDVAINEGAKYLFFDNCQISAEYSSPKFDGFSIRPVTINF